MTQERSVEILLDLFASETVVDLPRIETALGGASAMTAFRYLRQVPYRHSYNHNGRYYCLHEPSRYDRFGLWSLGDIYFSVDGSLGGTLRRLIYETDAGATHRELQERLRVRVQNSLLTLLRRDEVARERLAQWYVYLHIDAGVRAEQIQRRQALIGEGEEAQAKAEIADEIVIQVLLTLLRHPGAKVAEVVRYLRGHSPPISTGQVNAVFARYDLDHIDKKGGGSTF